MALASTGSPSLMAPIIPARVKASVIGHLGFRGLGV